MSKVVSPSTALVSSAPQPLSDSEGERAWLDAIARDSWFTKGIAPEMTRLSFDALVRFVRGENILEIGPAEGLMTERLALLGKHLVVVEGAETFCADLRLRFPTTCVVHSLFEEFGSDERFDTIIASHVLDHVLDPKVFLVHAAELLADSGCIVCSVPNSQSLHRQAAVGLGLLQDEAEMNEMDRHHGHRRIYNPESFRRVFEEAGLRVDLFGGYWLKPLSNAQLEESWTAAMRAAFFKLGERYPDIAAAIYVVASKPEAARRVRSQRPAP